MIIWLIVRSDRSDQWAEDVLSTPIEAITSTDAADVEARAADRLAAIEQGAPEHSGLTRDRFTAYSIERVWTVDGQVQG